MSNKQLEFDFAPKLDNRVYGGTGIEDNHNTEVGAYATTITNIGTDSWNSPLTVGTMINTSSINIAPSTITWAKPLSSGHYTLDNAKWNMYIEKYVEVNIDDVDSLDEMKKVLKVILASNNGLNVPASNITGIEKYCLADPREFEPTEIVKMKIAGVKFKDTTEMGPKKEAAEMDVKAIYKLLNNGSLKTNNYTWSYSAPMSIGSSVDNTSFSGNITVTANGSV